ncbi:hypothetical protein HK57_00313 [Aspergillus ustus]|uniref:NAD(P)-binding domain-containing protein n=1 Tax=Aspergillus ustus TaxID=40382 RepID=A0A0C1E712_ASPUT|nr:hypothetical protein HK57_00313 [Aspergillus ustus]
MSRGLSALHSLLPTVEKKKAKKPRPLHTIGTSKKNPIRQDEPPIQCRYNTHAHVHIPINPSPSSRASTRFLLSLRRRRPRRPARLPRSRAHLPGTLPRPIKARHLRAQYPSTLIVHRGNAHNVTDVLACLTVPNSSVRQLVSAITFTIGNKPDLKKMGEGDPLVCQKGMAVLLEALSVLRRDWGVHGQPLLCVVSTTGISETRDIPLLFYPLYHTLLAVPHRDKKVMEGLLVASGERFVLVRPSLLWDGERRKGKGKGNGVVRVGIADARTGVVERKEVGYTISREAVGGWMFEHLILRAGEKGLVFEEKAVSLTW